MQAILLQAINYSSANNKQLPFFKLFYDLAYWCANRQYCRQSILAPKWSVTLFPPVSRIKPVAFPKNTGKLCT